MMAPIQLALADIRAGKLRALGVTTKSRSHLLPEVPTVSEASVPGFDYPIWYGVWVPNGTPAGVVDKLAKDIVDQLVPASVRGKESKWSGAISTVGGLIMTTYDYENLGVTFLGDTGETGAIVVVITWKNRTCKGEGKQLPLEQYPR